MGMIRRILLFFVLLGCASWSVAQEVRVVGGRKCAVHVTQPGQTLFAIARSHAVTVDELLRVNPGAQDGLSIGEEVLIPLDLASKKELREAPSLSGGELLHTVRKKETLFGISRAYGMDMNALLERNPDAINLREGMKLVIPLNKVSGASETALAPAAPPNTVAHRVEAGETLFSLGKRYGVDPEAIRAVNGGLPEGLKADGMVWIPATRTVVRDTVPTILTHQHFKVGLLLPFAVQRNDSVLGQQSNNEDKQYYEPTRIAVQFYNGARIALDSLEHMGFDAQVDVVDLGDDMKTWNAAIKQGDLKGYDLFIGPFHRTAIEQLSRYSPTTPVVCPVPQSSKVILGFPNVNKVTPTRSDLVKHMARYVAYRHATDNIIFCKPDLASEKDSQQQCLKALQDALKDQSVRLRDSVLVVSPGRRDISQVISKLDASKTNVVVAPSDDVEFVTTLVGKLKPLATKFRIILVGSESWTGYTSIASSDLDLLGFEFAAPSYTDREAPRTRAFVKAYRERYKTDVDEYAMLGFDVMFYYGKALMRFGTDFPQHFAEIHTEPLHMGFRMTRTGPENGFRNEHAIMLQQRDLKLVKAP